MIRRLAIENLGPTAHHAFCLSLVVFGLAMLFINLGGPLNV